MKDTPNIDDTVARMCNFAGDYTRKNKSPNQLYEESGYLAFRMVITLEKLRQYVADHPTLVVEWLCYCDDPRTDMWVMREKDSGWYTIGRRNVDQKYRFDDAALACAAYIKLTFDWIEEANQITTAQRASCVAD